MVYGRHNKANQRWSIIYTDNQEKAATSGLDENFGFKIGKPFYIRSRMGMRRVAEAISANNVTLKRYATGRTA